MILFRIAINTQTRKESNLVPQFVNSLYRSVIVDLKNYLPLRVLTRILKEDENLKDYKLSVLQVLNALISSIEVTSSVSKLRGIVYIIRINPRRKVVRDKDLTVSQLVRILEYDYKINWVSAVVKKYKDDLYKYWTSFRDLKLRKF